MSKRIFVYGSLRRGQQANRSLRDCKFLEEVTLPGFDMYAVSWFPGIRHNPANEQGVVGELYELPEEDADTLIKNLDYYEGYREDHQELSLFLREEVQVNGEPTLIYTFNKDPKTFTQLPCEQVPGGNWVEYKEKHNAA
jgi:gamma-glutamylcyclotransferase (GGCT)/AIG2-like uncharacterized protein YtfP